MAKYDPLRKYLERQPLAQTETTMTFGRIEGIIGEPMEPSAYKHFLSWDNRHGDTTVRQNSWLDAGWETVMVDLENKKVKFRRKAR
jgi:hypothetical protein